VLERRTGHAWVVDAVHDAGAERADLRIVPVEDERGRGGQPGYGVAPPLCDQLELAVSVELVTEQVAEADRPRPQSPQHLGQGALVDLQQA